MDETVLVTRPAGQAEALCHSLSAAGYRPLHEPLLVVEALPGGGTAELQPDQPLETYRHCLFVSSNAATLGLRALLPAGRRWPAALACYAVGESTARVLRSAGLPVQTPGEDMTSEGLLGLPSLMHVRGQSVLIVKGVGGRTALRDILRDRGASVEEFCCYRRRAPDLDAQTFAALLRDRAVRAILASSGEVLENLNALLRQGPDAGRVKTGCLLIVPSERVEAQARAEGWQSVSVATNASDAAMLAALQRALPAGADHG